MTTLAILLWAFLWNLVGATLGLIPIGIIFLISRALARLVRFFK